MVELSRRSFLKMIGATGLILAAPTELLLPFQPVPDKLVEFSNMRILSSYNPYDDIDIIRYDVLYRNTQIFISAQVPPEINNYDPKDYLQRIHEPMVAALNERLRHDGIKRSELKPLPYPFGYKQPEWVNRIILGK